MEVIAILKPDIIINEQIDDIKNEIKKYFTIEIEKITHLDEDLLRMFYSEHANKEYFKENIVKTMTQTPVVAMILSTNKINDFYEIKNIKEKIRDQFAKDKSNNSIHISDSVESAYNERILLWW